MQQRRALPLELHHAPELRDFRLFSFCLGRLDALGHLRLSVLVRFCLRRRELFIKALDLVVELVLHVHALLEHLVVFGVARRHVVRHFLLVLRDELLHLHAAKADLRVRV